MGTVTLADAPTPGPAVPVAVLIVALTEAAGVPMEVVSGTATTVVVKAGTSVLVKVTTVPGANVTTPWLPEAVIADVGTAVVITAPEELQSTCELSKFKQT